MSDTSREFLQRFAISGLSKERKDEAINEEIKPFKIIYRKCYTLC